MAGFDPTQFESDRRSAEKEAKKYGLHHDKKFMKAFNGYMEQLRKNGEWVNAGHQPNPNWSGDAADKLMREFDRLNALHVPADWWRRHYKDSDFATQRDLKANETFKSNKYLWSKTEPYYPARQAAEAGGLILETSPPGKIFNAKNFGFERWSDAPVQADLWTQMSAHYVDGAQSSVEAVILEGRVANSVLTAHEWPHLKELIRKGQVSDMHVKVMNVRNDSQDSATWSLETSATFRIDRRGTFSEVPAPGPGFDDRQGRWRKREKERNPSKASSDSADTTSSGYSLDNLHQAFNDPNTVVVLSADPAVAESPAELSRVVSHQLTRVGTLASLDTSRRQSEGAGKGKQNAPAQYSDDHRQATIDAVRSELAAEAAAFASLSGKLDAIETHQRAVALASLSSGLGAVGTQQQPAASREWPGAPDYDIAQDLSGLRLRQGTGDYSPMEVPGAGNSYFPAMAGAAGPWNESPAALTETPAYAGGGDYFSPAYAGHSGSYSPTYAGQSGSYSPPYAGQSGSYSPPYAGQSGSYSPAYAAQERTPSTTSAGSSEEIVPLVRVSAHTGSSPRGSASSQDNSGHREHREHRSSKPQKKEPSNFLKWVAGAQGGPKKKGPSAK
ncbi:hypothetical protein [Streptomyces antibioticus]|uniref:hypothetical protein n=1 Tax=Streptomyces antibioticus TaxID=1890 RepID=UPI003D7537B4